MAIRSHSSQLLHDKVIELAAQNLGNWRVYTNPGQQKNARIGNSFPDIILTNKVTNLIEFVIEIETIDSVTAHEASSQWKNYAQLSGAFYLLVPASSRQNAEFLCRQYGIIARLATYWIDNNNRLQINYE